MIFAILLFLFFGLPLIFVSALIGYFFVNIHNTYSDCLEETFEDLAIYGSDKHEQS